MKVPILDLKPQYESIKAEIHQAIESVLESSAFIMGPDVKHFENEVASYLGVKHAIGVNSGTDALVIGLKSLGIGEGDEVITTPFSFFATAESISNVGACPIFVDIDINTFNIDVNLIKSAITSKTKAIMPVHLYGRPAEMNQIMKIALEHNLNVIEDCAQAFGAKFFDTNLDEQPKPVGTIGDVGAFSFFPSKNLGAYGDGGLIATNNDSVADMARMLRVHGAKKKYCNEFLGYNSRLDTLQAAILRVKLPHIDLWNEGRRKIAKFYNQELSKLSDIVVPKITNGHVFHQYTIRILNDKRDRIHKMLLDKGIGTMIYYPIPQDRLPVYNGRYQNYPVSNLCSTEVLSLPIWSELEPDKQVCVIDEISEILK